MALLRSGALQETELQFAKAAAPARKHFAFGKLTAGQKRKIRALYEFYRYLRVSFGAEYESGNGEIRELFDKVAKACHTEEVTKRLDEKFGLFFE